MKLMGAAKLLVSVALLSQALAQEEAAGDTINITAVEKSNGNEDLFVIPRPILQQLCPRGLRIWISDSSDIRFVAFHLSVNKPLYGATPSGYNADLGRPANGRWQYDLPDLYLQKGDQVYYWLHVVHNNKSYLTTDHSWTIPGAPCAEVNSSDFHCQSSTTVSSSGFVCSGQLLFEDEFDSFNFDVWKHEISASGGKHNEFQMFVNSRSNSYVRNGVLHLRPTLTEQEYGSDFLYNGVLDLSSSIPGERCTNSYNNGCYKRAIGAQILNPVMSARLQTAEAFSFQYGVVKIRAKMPRGDWLLPGLHLLPRHSAYGETPRSGQMTMAENRGNEALSVEGEPFGVQRVEMGLQYGISKQNDSVIKTHMSSADDKGWAAAFHDYEMEWTPEHIQFKVDGKEAVKIVPPAAGGFYAAGNYDKDAQSTDNIYRYGTKMAPFDKPFYVTLSLAVGGISGFFPDNSINKPYPKPWNNTSPSAALDFWEKKDDWYTTWQAGESDLQVDYIRIWALP